VIDEWVMGFILYCCADHTGDNEFDLHWPACMLFACVVYFDPLRPSIGVLLLPFLCVVTRDVCLFFSVWGFVVG
jgi:hypothetical protein